MNVVNRLGVLFFLSLFFLFTFPQAEAREWSIVGPRALGMGGAYVAVADDSTASYWNPAAYGFFNDEKGRDYKKRDASAVLDIGAGAQIHEGLGEQLDRIMNYDFDALDTGQIAASSVDDFVQLVNELKTFDDNKNRAVVVLANTGFGIQASHFGIGGYAFAEVSAKGDIDLLNIAPVTSGVTFDLDDFTTPANYGYAGTSGVYTYYDQPGNPTSADLSDHLTSTLNWTPTQAQNFIDATDFGLTQAVAVGAPIPSDILNQVETVASLADTAATSGGSFADNASELQFKGIAVGEVPLSYGRRVKDDLSVGGNFKLMKARVYNVSVPIFDTEFDDALDKATDNFEESQSFGIDLGVLYYVSDDLRVGMVGRNLNSPKFDMGPGPSSDDHIKEKPQLRAGAAYKPRGSITMAIDLDLTNNETTISNSYKSQNVAVGAELEIFDTLKTRAGVYQNLAESDIGLVYTAGLGIDLLLLNLDLGASMASESSEIDGDSIPKEGRVEFALSFLF